MHSWTPKKKFIYAAFKEIMGYSFVLFKIQNIGFNCLAIEHPGFGDKKCLKFEEFIIYFETHQVR